MAVPFWIIFLKLEFTLCKAEPSHYEAWSYKKKKHKKIKAYRKSWKILDNKHQVFFNIWLFTTNYLHQIKKKFKSSLMFS